MKKYPRILIDCDGVMANFVEPVVNIINNIAGTCHRPEDVDQWEIFDALRVDDHVARMTDYWIGREGFCAGLETYPGAIEGVEQLREFADVYAVTAPFDSDYWHREREKWLMEHLGFFRKKICQLHDKHLVHGDVLVDDKVSTLVRWKEHHPDGLAIFFAAPSRKDAWDGVRLSDWAHLVSFLESRLCK